MSKPLWTSPASAIAIPVDANDPNTTAPSETRVFQTSDRNDSVPYVIAIGGAITVQLWGYADKLARWVKIGAAQACAQDTLTYLPTLPPRDFGSLFLQVTVAAATQISVGFQGVK